MDRNQKLIELYAKCLANNYNDMSNETQQLKVKVFAMDLGLKYKKIETLFEEAKTAYEQHQLEIEREAQRAKKNAEIEEKIKQLQKNAKLAFTAKDIYDSEIKVYRCADGSVFCKQNNKATKYTDIEITVKAGNLAFYEYHPSKTVYTGASAGGIAMGGFHTTEAHYTQSQYKTEKGSIEIHYDDGFDDSSTIEVESITLEPEMAVLFKRLPGYKKHFIKNKAVCYDRSKSDSYWEATKYTADQGMRMELVSAAQNEAKCSYEKCAEIADILNSIIYNDFPAQDEEIYEKAIELSEIKDIAHLGKAIELFEYIIDYNDSKKHLDKIRPVYEALIQKEKETEVIRREKNSKIKKIILSVFVILAAISVVVAGVVGAGVKKNKSYEKAKSYFDTNRYSQAIEAFTQLGDYKDSVQFIELSKEGIYNRAIELAKLGKIEEACEELKEIEDYKNSKEVAEKILYENEKIKEFYYAEEITDELIKEVRIFFNTNEYIEDEFLEERAYIFECLCDVEWQYLSGDATTLSMNEYEKGKREYKTITTSLYRKYGWDEKRIEFSNGNKKITHVGGSSKTDFEYDKTTKIVTLKETGLLYANATVIIHSKDILEVIVEKPDGSTYSCKYKRAQ